MGLDLRGALNPDLEAVKEAIKTAEVKDQWTELHWNEPVHIPAFKEPIKVGDKGYNVAIFSMMGVFGLRGSVQMINLMNWTSIHRAEKAG